MFDAYAKNDLLFPEPLAARLSLDIAKAVCYMHDDCGLIHRNLSSAVDLLSCPAALNEQSVNPSRLQVILLKQKGRYLEPRITGFEHVKEKSDDQSNRSCGLAQWRAPEVHNLPALEA